MVMMKSIQGSAPRMRRLGVAEAKSKLSEVLREAAKSPTIIHSRGRDMVVVMAIEHYERLAAEHHRPVSGGALFLERVEALKQRHGGGVIDFEPARLEFVPDDPLIRPRAGRD